jgi:hypothetical protein
METYRTLDGEVLDLSRLDAAERAFFARCYAAWREGIDWTTLARLVEGDENPLLRATAGVITRQVYRHPLFQAVHDLEHRLGITQGKIAPEPGDDANADPVSRSGASGTAPVGELAVQRSA